MSTPGGSLGALPRATARALLPSPCRPFLALPGALFRGESGPPLAPKAHMWGHTCLRGTTAPDFSTMGFFL